MHTDEHSASAYSVSDRLRGMGAGVTCSRTLPMHAAPVKALVSLRLGSDRNVFVHAACSRRNITYD
jgi:hypothetical protein